MMAFSTTEIELSLVSHFPILLKETVILSTSFSPAISNTIVNFNSLPVTLVVYTINHHAKLEGRLGGV